MLEIDVLFTFIKQLFVRAALLYIYIYIYSYHSRILYWSMALCYGLTPCCGRRAAFRLDCGALAAGCPTGSTDSRSAPRGCCWRRWSPSSPYYPVYGRAYASVLWSPSTACASWPPHPHPAPLVWRAPSSPRQWSAQRMSRVKIHGAFSLRSCFSPI